MPSRLAILKTYKLYIGGKFPRTESGRYMTATNPKTNAHLANYCHASRKDLRDAVGAARSAFAGWSGMTAYLRGQILYRMAEMMESRRATFVEELTTNGGLSGRKAITEVDVSIDRLVYYAGWTDKYSQVFSSVNPVASSHFNFSVPEPTGVVGIVCPDDSALLGLVSTMATAILSGNTAVILASETSPLVAISLAEVLATSDLPGGVVNLLTGQRAELAPVFAEHMDINAIIDASADDEVGKVLQAGTAMNLKRYANHQVSDAPSPYQILDTTETKTAWHPVGA